MNQWMHRLYWLSAIILFAGLSTSKALTSIGIAMIGICALFELFRKNSPSKPLPSFLGFGVLFILYCSSAFYSDSIGQGLSESLRQHAFLSIPLCWWVLSHWLSTRIKKLIQVFLAATTFHCLLTILFFILPEGTVVSITDAIPLIREYPLLTDRLKFGLYTPLLDRLNFSYLIGFGLLYLIYESFIEKVNWISVVQGVIMLIAFALIGARGAQLSILAAIGIGVLSYASGHIKSMNLAQDLYNQRMATVIVSALIVLMTLPYLAYKTIPAVQKRYDQLEWEMRLINNGDYINEEYQYFTSLTRIRAWNNGLDIIKAHPILGVGIGDYNAELDKHNSTYDDKVPTHNQNFFLYIWGASGILALLSFLATMWFYTRSFWKGKRHPVRHLVASYVVFLFVSCMIDAYLKYHTGSISVMAILASLFLIRSTTSGVE